MKLHEYELAITLVATEQRAGAAFLRQRLLLSESKVQRLLKQMEKDEIVSPVLAGGAREVLIDVPAQAQARPEHPEAD